MRTTWRGHAFHEAGTSSRTQGRGALYLRRRTRVSPCFKEAQEKGVGRAPPTPRIVGMAKALELPLTMAEDAPVKRHCGPLWAELQANIESIYLNGHPPSGWRAISTCPRR